ncbi:CPBP family intramembrane metalloprotease [Paenibacillus sp. HWE-109]|uniref:CPBP family intramembrane glutamic endopeptidase n=1 Tax=Paenibacillus sp. HWE-109 TaxID=1306526 RepID=UPI001EDFBEAA|nr:CPBP family intramembrane glutamic endopeptidase [Paenibacillus sp. HWE-109]UKS31303.1 CPBP family intramembrane metalloprotease [Paenibacillus sp. HWE-109]
MNNQAWRNIVMFSLIAVSCGWIGRAIDLQTGRDATGSLGQLLWILSPLLSMMIMRTWMGDGWKDCGFRLHLKGNLLLYGLSILFFPLLAAIVVGIGVCAGWTNVSLSPTLFAAAFGAALVPSFIKNLCEELAWRGFLAPKLFALGYNRFLVHILVGVIWGAWHFPYLFLFTDDMTLMFLLRLMIGVIAMAVLYGEIRLITTSVWPAVLMHTMGNACIDTLILQKFIAVPETFKYLAMPSPEGLLAMALTGLAGLWVSRRNVRRPA